MLRISQNYKFLDECGADIPVCPRIIGRQECLPHTAGVTLVELLVAMLIFISIMGGVAILFSNASSTVAQANMAMDGYERARSSLARLERDMSAGFTARELGDTYQFYGQPNGLCFVGALESGQVGRVTYVIRPKGEFTTQTWARAGDVFARAFQMDISGNLAAALYDYCQSTDRFTDTGDSAQFWAMWITNSIASSAPANLDFGEGDPRKVIVDASIWLPVKIETGALVRYEEGNVRDIETFPMEWPAINAEWPGEEEPLDSDPTVYCEMHKTLICGGDNLPPCPTDFDGNHDLRKLVADFQPKVLDPSVVQRLLRAKKGELWVGNLVGLLGTQVEEYELVDHILLKALFSDATAPALDGFDVLGEQPFFKYTDGDYVTKTPQTHFNSRYNIPGYWDFSHTQVQLQQDAEEAAIAFDDALASTTGEEVGSPLNSRLPYSIHVRFWVVIESRSLTAPDFRRWFEQIIEIPCAFTRKG